MKMRFSFWTIWIFIVGIVPMMAQTASCPSLVENALLAVGDNCSELSRNSACYGFNQVSATFFDEMPEDYFAIPSDRAGLNEIDALQTAPLNPVTSEWGVAVMNIQANLPNTIPGQGVLMMLVGGATVENEVNPETANIVAEPLSTVTLTEANLQMSPSETAEVIEVLPANSIVLVDGFNTTRTWLRVVNDGVIGWIPVEQIARLAAMDSLPSVGATNPTPMQAFYLSTGIGQVECSEADSMIAVQSPENITVDLTVNGVDIKVGSLITFKNLDPATVSLTVHRGQVSTVFGNTINAGETALGVINSEGEQGDTIVAWGDTVPATEEELALGERAQTGLNSVARSNGWDEREVDSTSEPDTTASGEIIHIVSSGETLFGIGRLYDTSLIEIVNRNNLTPPYTLFAGDELVIPNPGSGFVGLPSTGETTTDTTPPQSSDEPVSTVACDTLRLTSPLQSAPAEPTPYSWDGIVGATQYQVNVYDAATGTRVGTLYTQGAETSLVVGAGRLGVGGAMQWEVIALINGEPICGTGLSQPITHNAPVEVFVPSEKAELDLKWYCGAGGLVVEWSNAKAPVTITAKDQFPQTYTKNRDSSRGSVSFSDQGYDFIEAKIKDDSGETITKTSSGLDC